MLSRELTSLARFALRSETCCAAAAAQPTQIAYRRSATFPARAPRRGYGTKPTIAQFDTLRQMVTAQRSQTNRKRLYRSASAANISPKSGFQVSGLTYVDKLFVREQIHTRNFRDVKGVLGFRENQQPSDPDPTEQPSGACGTLNQMRERAPQEVVPPTDVTAMIDLLVSAMEMLSSGLTALQVTEREPDLDSVLQQLAMGFERFLKVTLMEVTRNTTGRRPEWEGVEGR